MIVESAANSALIFSGFLMPGASSMPLETSMSSGWNFSQIVATLSGLMPPASQSGSPLAFSRRSDSGMVLPVPPGMPSTFASRRTRGSPFLRRVAT